MEKYFIICLLVFQIHNSAYSQNFTEEDRGRLAGYIFRQQYTNRELTSYGAIKTSDYPVIEDSLSGNAYFSVYPYFSHIACLGILNSKHSDKFNFVKLWIEWFIKHLDSRGNILNHYYTLSGEGTTCINKNLKYFCNDIDAEDSALALFWVVIYEYYKHSKDLTFFTVDVKKKLELSAHYVINNLLKENNLTIAKKDYFAYYTMDNCEVYKGFLYLSKIENEIYNDQVLAEYYQNKAENCKVAIQNLLYDYTTDLYKWELNINSNPDIWYGNKGGIVPTLWPQLFEVDQFSDLRSEYSRKMVEHKFPDWHSEKQNQYFNAFVGYIFSKNENLNKANRQLNLLLREYNGLYPSPPCYIGDAGWALLTMNIINPLLAVDETTHKKTDYQISPNPATSRFSILCTNPDKIKKIFLYNQEGKLIKKVNNKSEMEISELESGVYMVQITGDNFERPQNLKLIVQ